MERTSNFDNRQLHTCKYILQDFRVHLPLRVLATMARYHGSYAIKLFCTSNFSCRVDLSPTSMSSPRSGWTFLPISGHITVGSLLQSDFSLFIQTCHSAWIVHSFRLVTLATSIGIFGNKLNHRIEPVIF